MRLCYCVRLHKVKKSFTQFGLSGFVMSKQYLIAVGHLYSVVKVFRQAASHTFCNVDQLNVTQLCKVVWHILSFQLQVMSIFVKFGMAVKLNEFTTTN